MKTKFYLISLVLLSGIVMTGMANAADPAFGISPLAESSISESSGGTLMFEIRRSQDIRGSCCS